MVHEKAQNKNDGGEPNAHLKHFEWMKSDVHFLWRWWCWWALRLNVPAGLAVFGIIVFQGAVAGFYAWHCCPSYTSINISNCRLCLILHLCFISCSDKVQRADAFYCPVCQHFHNIRVKYLNTISPNDFTSNVLRLLHSCCFVWSGMRHAAAYMHPCSDFDEDWCLLRHRLFPVILAGGKCSPGYLCSCDLFGCPGSNRQRFIWVFCSHLARDRRQWCSDLLSLLPSHPLRGWMDKVTSHQASG